MFVGTVVCGGAVCVLGLTAVGRCSLSVNAMRCSPPKTMPWALALGLGCSTGHWHWAWQYYSLNLCFCYKLPAHAACSRSSSMHARAACLCLCAANLYSSQSTQHAMRSTSLLAYLLCCGAASPHRLRAGAPPAAGKGAPLSGSLCKNDRCMQRCTAALSPYDSTLLSPSYAPLFRRPVQSPGT